MRRGLLVVLLACAAARAGEDTRRCPDAAGKYNFELPATWEVTVAAPDTDLMVVALDVKAPGLKRERIRFELFLLVGAPQARCQAIREREAYRVPGKVATASFAKPAPHMIVTADPAAAKPDEQMEAVAYRMRSRVGLALKLICHRDDWPRLKAPFFAALESLRADLEEWPPLPEGFTRTVRDGYIYQRHPDVPVAEEKKLHAFVRKQERRFARDVAPVPKPEENRPMIALFAKRGDMGPIKPEAAADRSGTHIDGLERRVFTLRLSDEDPKHASLVHDLTYLFSRQAFGGEPGWLYQGETEVAYQYARTGERLPSITKSRYDKLPWDGPRFDFVAAGADDDWERFVAGSVAYTMFFRAGPPKYKKAFSNFLKDLRATGDWVEAERVHLLALDQDRMAATMKQFLEKRVHPTNPD